MVASGDRLFVAMLGLQLTTSALAAAASGRSESLPLPDLLNLSPCSTGLCRLSPSSAGCLTTVQCACSEMEGKGCLDAVNFPYSCYD